MCVLQVKTILIGSIPYKVYLLPLNPSSLSVSAPFMAEPPMMG